MIFFLFADMVIVAAKDNFVVQKHKSKRTEQDKFEPERELFTSQSKNSGFNYLIQ